MNFPNDNSIRFLDQSLNAFLRILVHSKSHLEKGLSALVVTLGLKVLVVQQVLLVVGLLVHGGFFFHPILHPSYLLLLFSFEYRASAGKS